MRTNLLKTSFFLIFLILSISIVASQSPPSLPQQFEGTIEVNGDQASEGRTIYAQVGDGELKETSVDSSGEYRIALSGEDGSEVSFFTENATGGMIEASTNPEDPAFESGGPSKTVDLDFSIEKPEPRVITGDIVDKGEDFAMLSARTLFVESDRDLYFEYSDDSRSYESESLEVNNEEYEVRIENLDYDTEYSYTAYLDGENRINGSTKDFETDNRPPFTVDGQTNLETGYVEAWIDGEIVKNESLDNSGDFRIEIDYTYSRSNEYVDIRIRDKEKTLEYISGNTTNIEFEFEEMSSSDSQVDQNEGVEENNDPADSSSIDEQSSQEEEVDGRRPSNSSQSDSGTTGQGNSVDEDSSGSNNQEIDGDQSLTGEFYQEQVNGTTVFLITAIIGVATYVGREYIN